MLVGILVDDGLISLEDTLAQIWPDQNVWANVDQAEEKQTVTIEGLLTMTSGLTDAPDDDQRYQYDLTSTLNHADYDALMVGSFR